MKLASHSRCFLALLVLLASAEAQSAPARIEIDAGKVENPISPQLYGQFTEFMFGDIKGGLHAELLRDRGFEEPANAIGLSRYWEREPDDRNDDPAMRFHWDDKIAYPTGVEDRNATRHSLAVELRERDGWRRGLHQSGVPVRAGVPYHAYVWLKGDFSGNVTAALEQDRTEGERYAASVVNVSGGEWTKYEFTLRPAKTDPLAKFVILFDGRGHLWLDQASLIPGDAVGDVRADVFAKIEALRPAFVRWPGGNVAQDYHWRWGIGPRDQRTTWTNLSWWNESEPSDFGTLEFLEFCRNLKAEPHLVVNIEGRGATPQEAASWVAYVNGPQTSEQGALRASHGHPQPYGVRTWELGNEIWGDWVRGHSDAETYARNYRRYRAAMHAVDPSLRYIAVGDNNLDWDRTVLRAAGRDIDLLSIHHYYGSAEMAGDPRNLMARPLYYERFYGEMRKLIRETVPGKDVKLIINEWNTSLPPAQQHSMRSALYGARLMNVFERSGDLVTMTSVSDLVNGWIGGIIQASRHDVFVTPTYLVNRLYANHLGNQRLATTVESPTFDSSREGMAVPYLDVATSRSADGREIYIKAVNTDAERSLRTRVNLRGVQVTPEATIETVNGESLEASNSFRTPEAVTSKTQQLVAGESFEVELPKHSVSVITLRVK
jgi:alpha-N-arabinofuranosidase